MAGASSLKEKLAHLYALDPLPNLARSWTFTAKTSEGPAIHTVRLGSEDDHLILLQCTQGFSPELAAAILNHVGDIAPDFFDEEPVRLLSGFSCPGFSFDRIVLVGPLAHNQFEAANPELQECTVVAFPAHACEFKGDEDANQVRTLRKYFVPTLYWARQPHPRLLMMHRNSATKSRSPGQKRGLARLDKCFRELDALVDDAESFVEVENISGQVLRLTRRAEHYELEFLEPEAPTKKLDLGSAKALVEHFLQ